MALTIRLWHSTYTARALEETTDHLDIAAIILDGNGRIIKNNHTAQEMMDQKQQLTQHNQQLDFLLPGHQTKFERAVAKAIAWRQAPVGNKPVEAMRFAYPSVDAIGVLVQAITPPTLLIPHATAVSPHVIVYINEPSRPKPHPQRQLIAHLFNLSAREAYLTSLLTSGHTVEEAAQVMNITHTTARTYLQHVYEKIGVNRRQDLVQRVMKSVALLA